MNATAAMDFAPSWYAETAVPFERPRLGFDLDVDVCVIGGGLAGLTVAREVARRGWSVAVLEARRVAWSASGRNCGFVLPGFSADPLHMVERIGLDHAKALWKLSAAGVEYVRATIRDTGMPGVDPVDGWLDVSKVDNGDSLLARVTLLGQEFGAEIEVWPTERVRATLRSDLYFHAIHFPTAFHIDPLNYARGLAAAAQAAGATIYEESPALAIDAAGVRKRVTTPAGHVRAMHVVLAGSAHLGALVPSLAETVMPVASHVVVTAPLDERLAQAIAYRGAVSDTRFANFHYRIVGGDRLMWAGGASLWPRGPRWAAMTFKRAIMRTYPQLGPVEIEHAWSGTMGFALHRMPQIGEAAPGLWLASAFGAHGLNTTAMAGELIAGAITDGDDRWRLFWPYELVWAGGALGRAVRHVVSWSRWMGEEVAASLARRREAARIGAPAAAEPPERPAAVPASEPSAATAIDASPLVAEVETVLHEAAQRVRRHKANAAPGGKKRSRTQDTDAMSPGQGRNPPQSARRPVAAKSSPSKNSQPTD
jgi:gamma-glutamylputrescine oxidase